MTDREQLAVALADAFLAGSWELDELRTRAYRVVGAPWSWVGDLALDVILGYARPPADRPRELVAFVLASEPLAFAERTSRRLPVPVVRLTTPTRIVSRPFGTPHIDHVGELAEFLGLTVTELDRLADTAGRARRAGAERIAHYRYRWSLRPGGGRLLEAPKYRLATVQRRVLDDLLAPIPVHPAAHGFVAERSAITGARVHTGSAIVVSLDLEHFFAAVTAGRIWGVLRAAGYPEPVAQLLAGLTTHATPVAALAEMPAGPDPGRDFRLRRRLAVPHLPQGASTSPQLANLVAFALDRRLHAYSRAAGFRYTRYADDLTFSTDSGTARRAYVLVAAVGAIVGAEGFRVNPAKTRIRRQHQRQVVTGIVVNGGTNLARPEFDRLKAVLHDCRQHGPAAASHAGHLDFRAHLLGRISWVTALNPARGARLLAVFDAVDWSG